MNLPFVSLSALEQGGRRRCIVREKRRKQRATSGMM
jgi:hypothetical protein